MQRETKPKPSTLRRASEDGQMNADERRFSGRYHAVIARCPRCRAELPRDNSRCPDCEPNPLERKP